MIHDGSGQHPTQRRRRDQCCFPPCSPTVLEYFQGVCHRRWLMPRIQADPLIQFAQALLQSLGGPRGGFLVARLLVDADLSGHDSTASSRSRLPGRPRRGLIAPALISPVSVRPPQPRSSTVTGVWPPTGARGYNAGSTRHTGVVSAPSAPTAVITWATWVPTCDLWQRPVWWGSSLSTTVAAASE
jgi:hypothetical protein